MGDVKAKVMALVAEIDGDELAVRILEAMMGARRPVGTTAAQALSISDPQSVVMARRAAEAAARYITECINAGRQPS